jgi:hypothetical protein
MHVQDLAIFKIHSKIRERQLGVREKAGRGPSNPAILSRLGADDRYGEMRSTAAEVDIILDAPDVPAHRRALRMCLMSSTRRECTGPTKDSPPVC